jgi:hypothetical protein
VNRAYRRQVVRGTAPTTRAVEQPSLAHALGQVQPPECGVPRGHPPQESPSHPRRSAGRATDSRCHLRLRYKQAATLCRRDHGVVSETGRFSGQRPYSARRRVGPTRARELPEPAWVCAPCARNGFVDSCLGHVDLCAQLRPVFLAGGGVEIPRLVSQRKCPRWM